MDTLYIFLPFILLLGVITSYTDMKYGKIKNKHILLALGFALVAYLFITLFMTKRGDEIRWGYFGELFLSMFFALFGGFIMWYVGLWTAGDAKLFLAYTAIVPLSVYSYGYVKYFPSMIILVNTFVPMFLFLAFRIILRTTWKQKIVALKKSLEPRQLFSLAVALFGLMWVISGLFNLLHLPYNFFLMIFLLFLLLTFLEKILPISISKVFIILAIMRLIFDRNVFTTESIRMFVLMFLAFVFIRYFILQLSFYVFTKEVDINLLEKGMIPAEGIYEENENYRKRELLYFSLFSYLTERRKKYIFDINAEGLDEEEVGRLHKLYKDGKIKFEHLRVYQTIPFAIFMFLGVLLTILVRGDIMIVAKLFLMNLF